MYTDSRKSAYVCVSVLSIFDSTRDIQRYKIHTFWRQESRYTKVESFHQIENTYTYTKETGYRTVKAYE